MGFTAAGLTSPHRDFNRSVLGMICSAHAFLPATSDETDVEQNPEIFHCSQGFESDSDFASAGELSLDVQNRMKVLVKSSHEDTIHRCLPPTVAGASA